MATVKEQVLAALFGVLRAEFSEANTSPRTIVERNSPLPEDVPRDGLLILRDGVPGEPETTMSPLRFHFEHRAEIEVFVRGSDSRDAMFDAILARLGAALILDRTLGGLCDWVQAMSPEPETLPIPGATPIKAATVPVMLTYSTADPLG